MARRVITETNSPGVTTTSLKAYSAYDLPSVEALVRYFHAAAGYPVKDTWLKTIRAGNYSTWPGLTLQNTTKYCPVPVTTLKGHMVQTRQNICSTKPKPPSTSPIVVKDKENDQVPINEKPSNDLHISVQPMSKLYTDDTGRFPVRSWSGNQYIMIAYHCNSNAILAQPFKTRANKHCMLAYNSIMQRLEDRISIKGMQRNGPYGLSKLIFWLF